MKEITIYNKIINFSELTGIEENKMRIQVIKRTYPKTWFRRKEKVNFKIEINDPTYLSDDPILLLPSILIKNNRVNEIINNIKRQEIWKADDFINSYKIKNYEDN